MVSRGSPGSIPYSAGAWLNKQEWQLGQTEVVFLSHPTPAVSDHPFVGQQGTPSQMSIPMLYAFTILLLW